MKSNKNRNPRVTRFLIVLLIVTIKFSNSEAQYLNPNINAAIQVPLVNHGNGLTGSTFFDMSPISGARPDISITTNALYSTFNQKFRDGQWNQNNGAGNFGNPNVYLSETPATDINKFKGALFVQLRDQAKKDFVILRDNQLQVHWNENNAITPIKQNITEGAGNYITKGSFNWQDNYEDVAVSTGTHIKIFKNLRSGYLEAIPIGDFSIPATKFKLAQITDRSGDYFPNNINDRADLVVYTDSTVSVYCNTNLNGFSFVQSFNAGFNINDIELADLNDDGYNELIIAGVGTAVSSPVKVFYNNYGTLDLSAPAYSNVSSNIPFQAQINIADFNADGINDLLLSGYQGKTSIFINTGYTEFFNNVPQQSMYLENPGSAVNQFKTADIYNTGGIALLMSYQDVTGYRLKTVNAVNFDIAPPPPVVSASTQRVGNFVRPKILIGSNRDVKDFQKYRVYKSKATTGWNFTLIGETTDKFYIDNTEFVLYVGGIGDAPPPNCYYEVRSVDSSNQNSIPSKQLGYRVNIPTCLACADKLTDPMGDNSGNTVNENKETQNVSPEKLTLTNFPNPFNPVTKIYYTLPKDGNVKISVYNSVGKLVKELVNEFKSLGYYTVEFNGSEFSSGVYFYRLEAAGFIETKRMILAK